MLQLARLEWDRVDLALKPSPRARHTLTSCPEHGTLHLFGGSAGGTSCSNELWQLELGAESAVQWLPCEAAPEPRCEHSCTAVPLSVV